MKDVLEYPFDAMMLMKKKRSIRRFLLQEETDFLKKKVAILGGSTTSGVKEILELFLLNEKIEPEFYEGDYNLYYEEAIFENQKLKEFNPDFIYLHIFLNNLNEVPLLGDSKDIIQKKIQREYDRLLQIWESLKEKYGAIIIQNNFALPNERYLGNLEQVDIHGYTYFILELNRKIVEYIRVNNDIKLNDIFSLSAQIGLKNWYDKNLWYTYKLAVAYDVIPEIAFNLSKIIKANLGKSKKCLVLDLDNTLWGGVISEDGVEKIQIGKETPLGEAYTAFQKYIYSLKQRGIILAVCSKNDMLIAKKAFLHPDNILKFDDFTVFKANWQEKHINILEIAEELNIGLDSIVFVDDNPAERQIIRVNLPMVAIPEINIEDVTSYIKIIDCAGYFEPDNVSQEDLIRNENYKANIKRKEIEQQFLKYDDFLKSLEMIATIDSFSSIYLDRITQLTNKTNQFNLTTRRYTYAEIEKISKNQGYVTLYGRLEDKFGDHGIVSVIIGRKEKKEFHIDLWIMSCRVLKRDMEFAMFDTLIKILQKKKVEVIMGCYIRTVKNNMVSDLYSKLGFSLEEKISDNTYWKYHIPIDYKEKCECITVNEKGI